MRRPFVLFVAAACALLFAALPAAGAPAGAGGADTGTVRVAKRDCRGALAIRKVNRRERTRGKRRGCRARRLRRRGAQLFGFTDNSVGTRQLEPGQSAAMARLARADVVRLTFDWRWAEPRKDDYRLDVYDAMYRAYLALGIRPVFTLLFSPDWTWDSSVRCVQWREDCTYPPARAHDDEWREIAALVAQRYPESAGIEIWNEPNSHWFWSPRPDVKRYTELQRAAYHAIKAVNPGMPVVTGGLLNFGATTDLDTTAPEFAQGIYRHGGGRSMDALNIHPYPAGLDKRWFLESFDSLRRVRNSHGDSRKPLWVTELGFSTTGTDPTRIFSREDQARGLVDHYRAIRAMPDVELLALYTMVEPKGRFGNYSDRDPDVGFGLIDRNLRPKPAFCALVSERRAGWSCSAGSPLP